MFPWNLFCAFHSPCAANTPNHEDSLFHGEGTNYGEFSKGFWSRDLVSSTSKVCPPLSSVNDSFFPESHLIHVLSLTVPSRFVCSFLLPFSLILKGRPCYPNWFCWRLKKISGNFSNCTFLLFWKMI